MLIKLPADVYSNHFYSGILEVIYNYIYSTGNDLLVFDFSSTKFIQPCVLCNFLSALQWVKESGKKPVHILLGQNEDLHDFLIRTQFYSIGIKTNRDERLLTTDQSTYVTKSSAVTDKIVFASCESVRLEENDDRKVSKIVALREREYQYLYKYLLNIDKIRALFSNISEARTISMFKGLIDNAWEHGRSKYWQQDCYYTFQLYEKTDFFFSISDWGVGFYKSLIHSYHEKPTSKKHGHLVKPVQMPKVLTLTEFSSLDGYKKDLAGIIEAICYRIKSGSNDLYGLSDIIQWYFLDIEGDASKRRMRIHSGSVLLSIDMNFLHDYFDIVDLQLINYRRPALRDLILKTEFIEKEKKRGNITIFNYVFPGVHIDANLAYKK